MRSLLFLSISLFIGLQSFAQDTLNRHLAKKFISLKLYEETFGKPVDTTEFNYRDNDTLVRVPLEFDPFKDKDYVKVEYEPKDSTFLSIYKNVVFNTGKLDSDKQRMRYWKNDIKIYFDESVPSTHAKKLMKFAHKVSKDVDSLNISRNFVREKSNYLVYYLNRENTTDFEPRIGNTKGGYYISWNGKQQIYDGKLKVNTEMIKSAEYQFLFLKYYFFKSLGHFKSSKQLNDTSFLAAGKKQRKLSSKDIEILKYHYSYGVCKGTDLKSFTELTSSMNAKLKKEPNAKLYLLHEK